MVRRLLYPTLLFTMQSNMASSVSQKSRQRRLRRITTMPSLPKVVLSTPQLSTPSCNLPIHFSPVLSTVPSIESFITTSTDDGDRYTSVDIAPPPVSPHSRVLSHDGNKNPDSSFLNSSNLSPSFDDLFATREAAHAVPVPPALTTLEVLASSTSNARVPTLPAPHFYRNLTNPDAGIAASKTSSLAAPDSAPAHTPIDADPPLPTTSSGDISAPTTEEIFEKTPPPSAIPTDSREMVVVVIGGHSPGLYPSLAAAASAITPGAKVHVFRTKLEARREMNRIYRQNGLAANTSIFPSSASPCSRLPAHSTDTYVDDENDSLGGTRSKLQSSRSTGNSISVSFAAEGISSRITGPLLNFTYRHGTEITNDPPSINTFIPSTEDEVFDFEAFINALSPKARFVSQSRHCYYAIARGRVRTIVGSFEEMYLLTRRLPFEPIAKGFFSFDAAKDWILKN